MRRTTFTMALVVGLCAGSILQAQDKGRTDDRFQSLMGLARVKRDAGDAATARRYFEDARRLRPFGRDELAEYFWVLAGHDAGAAVVVGREVLAIAPDNANLRDRVITEAIATGDETAVRAMAEEGARLQPGTARWPRRLGDSYLRQGLPEEAAAAFARATRVADATIDDHVGLALSLEAAKRYAEAVAAWTAVPPAARAGHDDWEHSRLRALAHGASPADAAGAIDAWLGAHTDDADVRDLLVDVWLRAGDPAKALSVLAPVPEGPAGDQWLRRRLAIARAANMNPDALTAVEALIARRAATAEDRRIQAELLVNGRQYDRAVSSVRALASTRGGCDDRLLTIADRLPEPFGTDLLRELLDRPNCPASARWMRRGIERLVAASNHHEALVLVSRLPSAEAERPAMLIVAGQVRVWTGDLATGIPLLERGLAVMPESEAARRTLDEAYRARLQPVPVGRVKVSLARGVMFSLERPVDPMAVSSVEPTLASDLARANVFAADQKWTEALDVIDAVLARDAVFAPALKLRAEVLSWSGRRAEAMHAYDVYLAAEPDDVDARRQQARVAGWDGQFDRARRLYATLRARVPGDAAVAAEAVAKSAYYDGRWREAVAAYGQWIRLEPDNSEARFEQAEALRADGQVAKADEALVALASIARHDQAAAALARARAVRGPSVAIVTNARSSDGYAGQRLLDLQEYGGVLRATAGQNGLFSVSAGGSRVRAAGSGASREGYEAGATVATTISPALGLDGHASVWNLATSGRGVPDLLARATWRPIDRWMFAMGAGQEPIFENLTTVERRLSAAGGFVSSTFDSPRTWGTAMFSRQGLSDGNARTRATLTMSRVLSDRFRQVRLVGWAESLAYRSASADYFSPARHLRADLGFEYAYEFSSPRFRGDRQQVLSGGYLIGVDDKGTAYHHPTVRLALEFARGIAVDANATWIRSVVYHETSAFIGFRLTGAAFGR